jgi:type IV secretory pathway VirJ component
MLLIRVIQGDGMSTPRAAQIRAILMIVVTLCGWSTARGSAQTVSNETIVVPGFGRVAIYAPRAEPTAVVLFISGDGGWNLGVIPMAEALRGRGALLVGIDARTFMKTLNAEGGCAYPAGDLERLSRTVQLKRGLAEYKPPIVVGYSSGATLAYAAVAAAPPETFAGAISLGFCPDVEIDRPLCRQNGLTVVARSKGARYDLAPNHQMHTPWMVLQGETDQVCSPATTRAFVSAVPGGRLFSLPKVGHGFAVTRNWESQYFAAYDAIVTRHPSNVTPTAAAPEVRDLELTEVPVPSSVRSDTMAIILSGDGGWADIDKTIAAGLAASGIPSVGWSSLRYYWRPRTPDGAAADLARVVGHYVSQWGVHHVILVGYSFGADVLPFLVNRLPPALLAYVRSVALLGPSETAEFEFRLTEWVGRSASSPYRTVPEMERLNVPLLCIRGGDEDDSACHIVKGRYITSTAVGAGHHFSGKYEELVDLIVKSSR